MRHGRGQSVGVPPLSLTSPSLRSGRSVFGRDDRGDGACTENRQHRLIILRAHAWLQRSGSLTRANLATVANVVESKQGEVAARGRGIRDGISRGIGGWKARYIWRGQVKLFW